MHPLSGIAPIESDTMNLQERAELAHQGVLVVGSVEFMTGPYASTAGSPVTPARSASARR